MIYGIMPLLMIFIGRFGYSKPFQDQDDSRRSRKIWRFVTDNAVPTLRNVQYKIRLQPNCVRSLHW